MNDPEGKVKQSKVSTSVTISVTIRTHTIGRNNFGS